jgi:hypothetical protein
MKAAIAAAVYGFAAKSGIFNALPTIPVLGRTGSIAVLAYLASKNGFGGNMARQVAVVAATIAGYQLGSVGSVSGDDDGGVDGFAVTGPPDDDEDD